MSTAKFSGRYTSLAQICEYVVQAAQSAGLDAAAIYEIELAANEASANIIDHAYGGESEQVIECTCVRDEGGLTVILRDWGDPFDPDAVKEGDFNVPLDKLSKRGAGLRIIRGAVDEMSYGSGPNGTNQIKLTKRKRAA